MIEKHKFGLTGDGREVFLYRLKNKAGVTVDLLNLGCIIQSIKLPGGKGGLIDVVLGYDTVQEYENDQFFFGALIGRWANRISGAAFELNGRKYALAANDGRNHLHGGPNGFHRHLWAAEEFENKVIFRRLSPDGEEGYPGNLWVEAAYTLTEGNELVMSLRAESDRETAVNLTNHSYFNLNGQGDILDHELKIRAASISEVDPELIPTGRLLTVDGGPFDFREFKKIGRDIEADDPQIKFGRGYDHNFVLEPEAEFFAEVRSAQSGLGLDIGTSLPGVQFYSGNFLEGGQGKGGRSFGPRGGFCLETQLFPDSINQPLFPSAILEIGHTYNHQTIYRFHSPNRAKK